MHVLEVRPGERGALIARVEIGPEETVRVDDLLPHFERRRYKVASVLGREGKLMGHGAIVTCRVLRLEAPAFAARDVRRNLARAPSKSSSKSAEELAETWKAPASGFPIVPRSRSSPCSLFVQDALASRRRPRGGRDG